LQRLSAKSKRADFPLQWSTGVARYAAMTVLAEDLVIIQG
jgi:hypothetical protein